MSHPTTSFVLRGHSLRFDILEERLLLSVSQPFNVNLQAYGGSPASYEIVAAPEVDPPVAPIPYTIPPDDTVDPLIDCPDLDEEYCLQRDDAYWYSSDVDAVGPTDPARQDGDIYCSQPANYMSGHYEQQIAPPIVSPQLSEMYSVPAEQDGYPYETPHETFESSYGAVSYDTSYSYDSAHSYDSGNSLLPSPLGYYSDTPLVTSVGYNAAGYYSSYYDASYYGSYSYDSFYY